jgi:hypothetical protein
MEISLASAKNRHKQLVDSLNMYLHREEESAVRRVIWLLERYISLFEHHSATLSDFDVASSESDVFDLNVGSDEENK